MKLRLGTRASLLARTQSGHVADWLRARGHEVELVFITTEGDRRTESLAEIGGKGLFLKELEDALLKDEVDFAVHSLKDVPAELPAGLVLAAFSAREDVRDAWISRAGLGLGKIPAGSRVGTGSLRRGALVADARPDVTIVPIRGNVDTRLRKLADGELDAILLASAGLRRLGRDGEITELLDAGTFVPAPGQGILAFECREERADVRAALAEIGDADGATAARIERRLLGVLGGDCRTPLGAWAHREGSSWRLDAFYRSASTGKSARSSALAATAAEAEELAAKVGDELLRTSGER